MNEEYAIYNPQKKPTEDLPVIYGFNNSKGGGTFLSAVLIAEDGTVLGGHACSSEYFMLGDLGILKDSRPDRHETFKTHYPDGYRMDFVSGEDVETHIKLKKAFELNEKNEPEAKGSQPSVEIEMSE
uniref:Uncharacterized protein n=1 Tax=viral metagenome TaxID=1070528 RepID=A0A6M3XU43_9ZZZZ